LFAWHAIVVNKLRTVLSLLGVTVGIFSIITVFTLVDTMENGLKDSFDILGDDVLFIQKWPWAPENGKEYEWWKYFQRSQPTMKNMEELSERLESADAVSFQVKSFKNLEHLNNNLENAVVSAVNYDYYKVIKLDIAEGRYFTPIETDAGRNVCIIGAEIEQSLFPSGGALGKSIKIGGTKADVIGVFQKEGSSLLGSGFDQSIFIPYGFGSRIIDVKNTDSVILVKAKEGVSNVQLKDEIMANMRAIRSIRPSEEEDFAVNESSMISSLIDSVFSTVNLVGFIIGIFAILVGGFSIANIMFVSVKERTNIIGIQKALGARNSFILLEFLFESVALCIFGGIAGLLLVGLIALVVNAVQDSFTIGLYFSNLVWGMVISVIIGVISGIVPASVASRLNPVDAIRSK
jgi:putative ABC transport system permease protein